MVLNSCIKACVEHTSAALGLLLNSSYRVLLKIAICYFLPAKNVWNRINLCICVWIPTFFATSRSDWTQWAVCAPWKGLLLCVCARVFFFFFFACAGTLVCVADCVAPAALSHQSCQDACVKFFWPVKKWFDSGKIRSAQNETDTSN